MSAIVDIEPLMRGLYEEMQTGGETYSTQSVYDMLEKETEPMKVYSREQIVNMIVEIDKYLLSEKVDISIRSNILEIADKFTNGVNAK